MRHCRRGWGAPSASAGGPDGSGHAVNHRSARLSIRRFIASTRARYVSVAAARKRKNPAGKWQQRARRHHRERRTGERDTRPAGERPARSPDDEDHEDLRGQRLHEPAGVTGSEPSLISRTFIPSLLPSRVASRTCRASSRSPYNGLARVVPHERSNHAGSCLGLVEWREA